ncbi:MAG: group III truncated hemoglobin [Chitinophagaceae bacterium]|nr:group III truncated hemoglobin [Chitinophagaceae bacterium]
MKPDIASRADIEKVVHLFYDKVKTDEVISFFFFKVIPIDWEQHMSVMCSFWENVLFFTGHYEGNPLVTHRRIHQRHPTQAEHFNRWLVLFNETVDSLFSGPNTDKMKQHAKSIAAVMQQKL